MEWSGMDQWLATGSMDQLSGLRPMFGQDLHDSSGHFFQLLVKRIPVEPVTAPTLRPKNPWKNPINDPSIFPSKKTQSEVSALRILQLTHRCHDFESGTAVFPNCLAVSSKRGNGKNMEV